MALISPILRDCSDGGYTFWCPGCDTPHHLVGWEYNGNAHAPTFKPSLMVTWGHYVADSGRAKQGTCFCRNPELEDPDYWSCGVCHSFITDGKMQFLNDCTHKLAGQTVSIPEWPKPTWHDG